MAPRKAERMRLARKGKAEGKSERGAPEGSYPTDTPGRARAAKGYATKAVEAGRMSSSTEHGIDERANKELGKRGERTEKVKTDRGEFRFRKPA